MNMASENGWHSYSTHRDHSLDRRCSEYLVCKERIVKFDHESHRFSGAIPAKTTVRTR